MGLLKIEKSAFFHFWHRIFFEILDQNYFRKKKVTFCALSENTSFKKRGFFNFFYERILILGENPPEKRHLFEEKMTPSSA
jgi:hypothetical protein